MPPEAELSLQHSEETVVFTDCSSLHSLRSARSAAKSNVNRYINPQEETTDNLSAGLDVKEKKY